MSKFRYYITDVTEGCVVGTDDRELAENYAESDDYFVVDSDNGQWLLPGGDSDSIEAAATIESEEEEEEEDDE